MKIKLTSICVDDQDKALRFYTEVMGLLRRPILVRGHFHQCAGSSAAMPAKADAGGKIPAFYAA